MRTRIRCPWHNEKTPSLVRQKTAWHCYGACGRNYTQAEVEAKVGEVVPYEECDDDKEDIQEKLRYIESLPRREIRGLFLPADERSYYITWPDGDFYKARPFNPLRGSKYLGPKGHVPPLYWARKSGQKLIITEGEINALSIAQAFGNYAVCSPGASSMFGSDKLSKYLPAFLSYDSILVILDDDPAGTKGLIEAKAFFLYKHPFVSFVQLKTDANDILQESGPEGLRQAVQGAHTR